MLLHTELDKLFHFSLFFRDDQILMIRLRENNARRQKFWWSNDRSMEKQKWVQTQWKHEKRGLKESHTPEGDRIYVRVPDSSSRELTPLQPQLLHPSLCPAQDVYKLEPNISCLCSWESVLILKVHVIIAFSLYSGGI